MDQVPMMVLGCGIRRDSGRAFQLHDVDQQALVKPVVKATYLVERTADLQSTIREACRIAREGVPGPVFVEVPANLYMVSEEVGDGEAGKEIGEDSRPAGSPFPVDRIPNLTSALEVLKGAGRPLLYVGAGAAGAAPGLVKLAESLEAPVCTTIQGKGIFPESHALSLWPGFGDMAPRFVSKVTDGCDAVLAIGCRFAEVGTGSYGMKMPGPLIHVDLDPEVFNRNYPAEVTVQADAQEFVTALLAELKSGEGGGMRGPDEALRGSIRDGHEDVWEEWLKEVGGNGVTPAFLLKTLQDHLGPEAVYATDSGNGTFLAMECLRLDRPGLFLAPVDFSCMGYSVPAAIGAKLGKPGSPVVALAGDGAFLMTGLEVLTAAREGVGVMVMVLRDRELAQIAQFQATALSRQVASEVADYNLRWLAKGVGIEYLPLDSDDEVPGVVERAASLTRGGQPVLVDVAIDYSEKTFFTKGVVKTNLLRLPFRDQVRFVGRALKRKLTR
jgi:acetolactate synthase-1/2/3 large subunit